MIIKARGTAFVDGSLAYETGHSLRWNYWISFMAHIATQSPTFGPKRAAD
jgi:hypothetical protein